LALIVTTTPRQAFTYVVAGGLLFAAAYPSYERIGEQASEWAVSLWTKEIAIVHPVHTHAQEYDSFLIQKSADLYIAYSTSGVIASWTPQTSL
jgi:hypothetical protein